MDVKFISSHKGNTVIQCPEIGPKHVMRFVRGKYKTADKREIKRLLSDSYASRYVKLAPGQDLEEVSNYLDSDERPDVMTTKYLNEIPFDAWKEILEQKTDLDVKFPLVGLAKSKLEGKPIDPVIEEIVEKWKAIENPETEEAEEVEETEEVEPEKKVTKITIPGKKAAVRSTDMNAQKAMAYIRDHELDELEGFIPETEDRKSVINEWNRVFKDNQIELPE